MRTWAEALNDGLILLRTCRKQFAHAASQSRGFCKEECLEGDGLQEVDEVAQHFIILKVKAHGHNLVDHVV